MPKPGAAAHSARPAAQPAMQMRTMPKQAMGTASLSYGLAHIPVHSAPPDHGPSIMQRASQGVMQRMMGGDEASGQKTGPSEEQKTSLQTTYVTRVKLKEAVEEKLKVLKSINQQDYETAVGLSRQLNSGLLQQHLSTTEFQQLFQILESNGLSLLSGSSGQSQPAAAAAAAAGGSTSGIEPVVAMPGPLSGFAKTEKQEVHPPPWMPQASSETLARHCPNLDGGGFQKILGAMTAQNLAFRRSGKLSHDIEVRLPLGESGYAIVFHLHLAVGVLGDVRMKEDPSTEPPVPVFIAGAGIWFDTPNAEAASQSSASAASASEGHASAHHKWRYMGDSKLTQSHQEALFNMLYKRTDFRIFFNEAVKKIKAEQGSKLAKTAKAAAANATARQQQQPEGQE